jgi:rhodanese-related sulfurtransferase
MNKPANKMVILDVRTPEEVDEIRLIGSQNIDFNHPQFREQIGQLDRDLSYKVYCRSGNRSGRAVEMMRTMGFKDAENLGSVQEASATLKVGCE